ncbi:MAG: bifunctional phosphoribosylaminoimidazolecarboxamide formyltransferase/IMP cyclohydrolase [Planctomycetaceae bacterium]|nr:bifunctional phosphoribosylaminoimidazolecarboxamide formyltransferase/IMP cyclohydrolase [Planctomycetaceae bacterium]
MDSPRISRALISVSDKLGLAEFAKGLASAGVEIFSTGGTAQHLRENGIEVRDISAYTGFPEMMDGRLKTLHPKVFGGILCRHDREDDMQGIDSHGIASFELVVVNLYPFEATIARENVTMPEAIEQIDIGGPSLVRAAAKNHAFVTIATAPEQYADILQAVQDSGSTSFEQRQKLAGAAFARTAVYDSAISQYFSQQLGQGDESLPERLNIQLQRRSILRYGENPHQGAALYSDGTSEGPSLISARQLNGKELSYNNLLDLDSAMSIVRSLPQAAAVVIKHNNPCGCASAESLAEAVQKALDGDPVSAFGSILAFNQKVDVATADVLATPGLFIEAIVAPHFDPAAVEILTTRPKWKSNVRLMEIGDLGEVSAAMSLRHISGGVLVQASDTLPDQYDDWTTATTTQPDAPLVDEIRFSWAVVRHVKSNAIVVTKNQALCGAGAGQMSRVDSVEIALQKAGDRAIGSVLASDAFFPFPDSIHRAAQAGVAAIIQPGGSKRDSEVIAACDEHQIPMVFTGKRHFKH